MADIFDVLADPTRRDLLRVLLDSKLADEPASGELSVGEMVGTLKLSQPTISKHLKVLRDIGLVSVREEGQHRFYRLDPGPLEVLEDWLVPFMALDLGVPDGEVGMTVLSAWAGENLRAPLRRVAAVIHDPSEAGVTVGKRVADGTRRVRRAGSVLCEAAVTAREIVKERTMIVWSVLARRD